MKIKMGFRGIVDSFMHRGKQKAKPLSERISDAVAEDTIRKYMYLNKGLDSLLFYKKGDEWEIVQKPENCLNDGIKNKLENIFSGHIATYESLYNDSHFKLDKVKYTRNNDCAISAVEMEFKGGSSTFMTREYSRILRERMRELEKTK